MAFVYAQVHSTCYYFYYGSIIPTGFKFTELHALTLATRSYALRISLTQGTHMPVIALFFVCVCASQGYTWHVCKESAEPGSISVCSGLPSHGRTAQEGHGRLCTAAAATLTRFSKICLFVLHCLSFVNTANHDLKAVQSVLWQWKSHNT